MRLAAFLGRFRRDQRGLAAIEMAFVASAFAAALLNAVDVGRYAYVLMEAEQATQAGAQAAYVTCDSTHIPATQNCPGLNTAVTAAVQNTSLGSAVALNGAIGEGYYCVNSSGVLTYASDVNSKPADCSAYGVASGQPALYLQVHTTYHYTPIFGSFSIAGTFPATVTKTAWMRMD